MHFKVSLEVIPGATYFSSTYNKKILRLKNIWSDYKKEEYCAFEEKLSWRRVFTAGFYVCLIVALKQN